MSASWAALRALKTEPSLRSLFAADSQRFGRFSAQQDDLLLDYSKTALTAESRAALLVLAEECQVAAQRDAMFAGEPINRSEGRAVLHTALRAGPDAEVHVKGLDVMPMVRASLARLGHFAEGVRSGAIAATDGGRFTDVVNIGIGGS
ncbi:MAG: glucose-6-phosphate isomerase, partial [Elstera sp.]